MKFFKDWLVQKANTYIIDGVPKVLTRDFGTIYQEGDKDKAEYFNEIQKNCIYSVNATRVVEGVLEIYDISITGSDVFPLFNTKLLINFNETNTKVDSVLRWNGKTYQIRKNTKFTNEAFVIGEIQKTNLVVLDQINSLALVSEFRDYERFDEVNVVGNNGGQNVVIPSNLPIGYEKIIRKTGTTGIVNITLADTNEKFTTGLLTQISINSDGDFWKIKKVSSTRWDLIEGQETGSNANGSYIRSSNGEQTCRNRITSTASAGAVVSPFYYGGISLGNYAKPFAYIPSLVKSLDDVSTPYLWLSTEVQPDSLTYAGVVTVTRGSTFSNISVTVSYIAEGRWY